MVHGFRSYLAPSTIFLRRTRHNFLVEWYFFMPLREVAVLGFQFNGITSKNVKTAFSFTPSSILTKEFLRFKILPSIILFTDSYFTLNNLLPAFP